MKSTLAIVALLLLPAGAVADEFTEYRVPAHDWRSGSASFGARGSKHDGSRGHFTTRQADGGVSGRASLEWGHDSDRQQYGLQLSGEGFVAAGHDEYRAARPLFGGAYERDFVGRSTHEQLQAAAHGRYYPWAAPVAFGASAALAGSWDHRRSRTDEVEADLSVSTVEWTRRTMRSRPRQYQAILRTEFGFGLVRHASVVEDVHVLESRLLECGAIVRALSPATREKLAALLVVAPNLSAAHDRPERYEWREIERVLREDGALARESLDAYAVMRAREEYRGSPTGRRVGYYAGVRLEQRHERTEHRVDFEFANRVDSSGTIIEYGSVDKISTRSDQDEVWGGASVEWHRPIGWRWQLDAASELSAPMRRDRRGLDAATGLEGSWHIADRWVASANLAHRRVYETQSRRTGMWQHSSWSVAANGRLDFLVEDQLTLGVIVGTTQQRSRTREGDFEADEGFSRIQGVSAGLTYRFLGRVSAPGLFETMTPMR